MPIEVYPVPGQIASGTVTDLQNRIGLLEVPSTGGWIAPTLLNSWVNYDAGASSFETVGYKKIAGIVYFKGLMASGTSTAFVVPAGYRPASGKLFNMVANTGTVRIDVNANGNVNVGAYTGTGSNAFVSLAGIIYPAEL